MLITHQLRLARKLMDGKGTASIGGAVVARRDFSETGELLDLEMMTRVRASINNEGKRIYDGLEDEEPDWFGVANKCRKLLAEVPDLRVAAYLIAACLRIEGVVGFSEAMVRFKELMSLSGQEVMPYTTNHDSLMERLYTVASLSASYKKDGDQLRIIEGLRGLPIVKMDGVEYCFRDLHAARTRSGGSDLGTLEKIRNAWGATECTIKKATTDALQVAMNAAREIETLLRQQLGEQKQSPDVGADYLKVLLGELHAMNEFIGENPREAKDDIPSKNVNNPVVDAAISSREDAIKMLTMVAEYFRRTEPASPVPYFVERTIRLVDQNFLALLNDLAPDAVDRFNLLAGLNK